MNFKIFCLFGDYRSGKSYFTDKLIEHRPNNFIKFSFADKVKELFIKEFDIKEDICKREVKEKYRDQIIEFAEKKKIKQQNYWAKIVIDEIKTIVNDKIIEFEKTNDLEKHKSKENFNFIIDDLRFIIEVTEIENLERYFKQTYSNQHNLEIQYFHIINSNQFVDINDINCVDNNKISFQSNNFNSLHHSVYNNILIRNNILKQDIKIKFNDYQTNNFVLSFQHDYLILVNDYSEEIVNKFISLIDTIIS